MSKNDNLTDLLTDVADAIRAKKGTSDKINPQDFSSEIASIETGGGGTVSAKEYQSNDFNFFDYDGRLVYSCSKDDVENESFTLPSLPQHEGLVCQGWNKTKEDLLAYAEKYGRADVGAIYITDDGKTRLYITIEDDERLNVPLYFSQTISNDVTIDWGDGSATETISGKGEKNATHNYNRAGSYVITLSPANGKLVLGDQFSGNTVMGDSSANSRYSVGRLRKVEIGRNVTYIDIQALSHCSVETITIPNNVISIMDNAFQYCYSLKHINIPSSVTSISNYCFDNCFALQSISLPNEFNIMTRTFYNCYALKRVIFPLRASSMGSYVCYQGHSLTAVSLPDVPAIPSNAFREVECITRFDIPSTVTSIGNYAFYGCYGVKVYDFSKSTSVPSLSNTNAFTSIPSDCKIVVPDSLYDSWIATTNWSTYANYIIKKSDYEAQNA